MHLLSGNISSIVDGSIFYSDRDNVWFILLFIGMIIMAKAFATSATTGAGGIGGTFAPSLYVGCMAGFFFAYLLNELFGLDLSVKNFALMGMAGVMSAVMHAPLMGIFLTAELTGGYELFLPLLIVSTLSYGTIKLFEPYSIYAMRLAQRGELLTHHKDKAVLTLLKVDNVIETDFMPVDPNMNLKEMVGVISRSNRNLYPVLDKEAACRSGAARRNPQHHVPPRSIPTHVCRQIHEHTPGRVVIGQSMEQVMKTFDDTGAWNLLRWWSPTAPT